MPASIACAKAGVTTGEWGGRCARRSANTARRPASATPCATTSTGLDDIRADVDRVSRKLGRRLTFLVGKPGLDGHSNGAEQIAVRARDAGMQVVYEGIRLTPEEIVAAAQEQKAHVVGLSILSGSHLPLVKDVVSRLKAAGLDDLRSWSAASSRRRTRRRWNRPASPRSIRRRTSSSTASCPTWCGSSNGRTMPATPDRLNGG